MDEQAQATMDTLNALHYAKWWTPQWVDAVGKGTYLETRFRRWTDGKRYDSVCG